MSDSSLRKSAAERPRHAWIPEELLRHPAVKGGACAVITGLALHVDDEGLCWPSHDTLAGLAGMSRGWIIEKLQDLVDAGVVVRLAPNDPRLVAKGKTGRSNGYHVPLLERAAPAKAQDQHENPHQPDNRQAAANQAADSHPADSQAPEQEQAQTQTPPSLSAREASDHPLSGTEKPEASVVEAPAVLPVDAWQPDPADQGFAAAQRPDVDLTAFDVQFRLGVRSRDTAPRSAAAWSAMWRKWLINERGCRRRKKPAPNRLPGNPLATEAAGSSMFAAWAMAADASASC